MFVIVNTKSRNTFYFIQELFKETCKEAKEKLGPCAVVLDNASYHKRLTSEKTEWATGGKHQPKKYSSIGRTMR